MKKLKVSKSKTLIFVALVTIFSFNVALAQNAGVSGNKEQYKKERVQAMKVAFLTDKLNLTAADAEKFWPVYNEFQDKRDDLQKTFRQKAKITKDTPPELLTDEKADEIINAQLQEEQSQLDLKKEYLPKFKKLIGSKKVVGMYLAEKEFNKMLLEKLKDQR
jgi:hypothetical protein